jgi:hypothetical protein
VVPVIDGLLEVAGCEVAVDPGVADAGRVVELDVVASSPPRPSAVEAVDAGSVVVVAGSATWSCHTTGARVPGPEAALMPTPTTPAVTTTAATMPARWQRDSADHLTRNAPIRPIRQMSTRRRPGLSAAATR